MTGYSYLQISIFLILVFVVIAFSSDQGKSSTLQCEIRECFCYSAALATSCQVYPSAYAYHDHSVNRAESASAICRMYPISLSPTVGTENYIHCDSMQLRLADSDLGTEQYSSSDHYVWSAGMNTKELPFIFSAMVNLVAIRLHYYHDSDSIQGRSHSLPKLKFYAVPEDFDIWDAPRASYKYVEVASVPPGGEPAGRRSVNISVNLNTKKVLMQKFSSSFQFALSEVEFFICHSKHLF